MNNGSRSEPFYKLRTSDGGLEVWFSICSKHRMPNDKCKLCNVGIWVNWEAHLAEISKFEKDPEVWQKKVAGEIQNNS